MSRDKNYKGDVYSQVGKSLLKKASFNTSRLLQRMKQGRYTSIFYNKGLEYTESRPYVYGDDARYIDWTISSRMSETYSKYFHEDTNKIVWTMFDCSGSMQIGAPHSLYEQAIDAALIFMQLALYQKNKVGGLLFGDDIIAHVRPSIQYSIVDQFLGALLSAQYKKEKSNLDTAIKFSRNILTNRALIIVFSDLLIEDAILSILKLSKIHDIMIIKMTYDKKRLLPNRGLLPVSDSEASIQGLVSLSNERKHQILHRHNDTSGLEVLKIKKNVQFLSISTTDSVFDKVLYFLLYGQK